MTEAQHVVLDAIEAAIEATGFPPTIRELMTTCGFASPSSAAYQVQQLESKGYIRRFPRSARAIQIVRTGGGAR